MLKYQINSNSVLEHRNHLRAVVRGWIIINFHMQFQMAGDSLLFRLSNIGTARAGCVRIRDWISLMHLTKSSFHYFSIKNRLKTFSTLLLLVYTKSIWFALHSNEEWYLDGKSFLAPGGTKRKRREKFYRMKGKNRNRNRTMMIIHLGRKWWPYRKNTVEVNILPFDIPYFWNVNTNKNARQWLPTFFIVHKNEVYGDNSKQ